MLSDGAHTISASETDTAGNTGSASIAFTLDTTAPAAPSTPDLIAASDSGASNTDNITKVSLPSFSGIGEDGATVTLLDGATAIGTATVSGGAWSITASTALIEGANSITAKQTDVAGNISIASSSLSVTLDTTAPAVTAALTSDTGASSSDSVTKIATLHGTGDANAVVTLTEGVTPVGTTTADGTGAWSFTPVLSDGAHTISASETDTAGNTGTVSIAFTLDTTAPAAPSAPDLLALSDSGASSTDNITNVSLPSFSGTGENGATVTLLDGTTTIGTGTVSGSTWSITASTALSEGANSITAKQTDVAGNISIASSPLNVTLDTTAPAAPSKPDLLTLSDSGASSTDNITNVSLPIFSGIGENGATVTLLDGATTIGTGTVSGGTWSLTASTALSEGANSITAKQTDVAGNTSIASSPLSVTLDTMAPAVTAVLASDTGVSSTDAVTSNATLHGTGDANAVVTLTEGMTTLGTTTATGTGAWSFTPTLMDGAHTISASETDTAGNTGSTSIAFTLDTIAPGAPSTPDLLTLSDSGTSGTDNITNVSLPSFSGTAENGAIVTLLDGSTTIGTATVSGGAWSITASTALSEGANSITAEQTDVAGNISIASAPLNVTLDTTAPAAPSAPVLAALSDSGASATDNITSVSLPSFSGSGENGAIVTLLDGSTTIGTGTVFGSTWSITAATALSEGANSITAKQTDVAGNISIASSPLSVTLDTMAPAAPSTPDLLALSDSGASSTDNITNVGLPSFSGSGENGATVTLLDGTTTIGTGTVTAGAWSITASAALSEGANSITATQIQLLHYDGVGWYLDVECPGSRPYSCHAARRWLYRDSGRHRCL